MRNHLRSMAKRKVSDFLLREEGMVGNRSAFATAALVSTTALAMSLLVAPDAGANHNDCPKWNCGPEDLCVYCDPTKKCCTLGAGDWIVAWCIDKNANCP